MAHETFYEQEQADDEADNTLKSAHDTVLVEGMVLTLEPSIETTADGLLLVHEENIVITQSGAEFLSPRAPRDFRVF